MTSTGYLNIRFTLEDFSNPYLNKISLIPISFNIVKNPFKKHSTIYFLSFSIPEIMNRVVSLNSIINYDIKVEFSYVKNNFEKKLLILTLKPISISNIESSDIYNGISFVKCIAISKDDYLWNSGGNIIAGAYDVSNYEDLFSKLLNNFKTYLSVDIMDYTIKNKYIPSKYKVQKIFIPDDLNNIDAINFVVNKYKTHTYPSTYFYDSFSLIGKNFYELNIETNLSAIKGCSFIYKKSAPKVSLKNIPMNIVERKKFNLIMNKELTDIVNAGKIKIVDEMGNYKILNVNPDNKSVKKIIAPDDIKSAEYRIMKFIELIKNMQGLNLYYVKNISPSLMDIGHVISFDGRKYNSAILSSTLKFYKIQDNKWFCDGYYLIAEFLN